MRLGGERDTHSSTSAGRLREFFLARRTAGGVRRRRKYRPGCPPVNTQVGISRQMAANPDLGIRFWTPSSFFVALPPLRQPAPPPAIRGDSVAALALERTQSPMVFSTTRDGPQAQKGSAALLLMSTTVLMQLLKLLVTFTVVLVTFTTLLVIFTVVLVQQFLILVTCEMSGRDAHAHHKRGGTCFRR